MINIDKKLDLLNREEYPANLAENAIPMDTVYDYVSATFLNGIINYAGYVVWAIAINLYKKRSSEDFNDAVELWNVCDDFHTNLHFIEDNVVLVTERDDSFFVFYFDCDVSDCRVARLSKENFSFDEVKSYASSLANGSETKEVKTSFSGWMSF